MSELDLDRLLRPELAELSAYLPDLGQYAVRLDANEAPPLLSEAARLRLAGVVNEAAWERYPDPTARELRAAIAKRCGVEPEEVVAGTGSDEVIALLLTALSSGRGRGPVSVVTTTPTFVMYRMSARVRGMQVVEVPLDADWDLAVPSMIRAVELSRPNLIFVASPNNPTSTMMTQGRLEQVIEAARDALVVVDEAYVDYSSRDQLALYRKYGNVAILRTLSKVGFASLRVGWLLARRELSFELDKVRLPYNIPVLSQRLAALALNELAPELAGICRYVIGERERTSRALLELPGVRVAPSEANFLWISSQLPAAELFEGLRQRSVLVRSFHQRGGRLASHLRVTVGTRAENDRLVEAVREVLCP